MAAARSKIASVTLISRANLKIMLQLLVIFELFATTSTKTVHSAEENKVGESKEQPVEESMEKFPGRKKLDDQKTLNEPSVEKLTDPNSYLDRLLKRDQVDAGFVHAFLASFSVILVSEIADKTFFIAAIMAMRHSRITVFTGAITALAVMTVLSVFLGYATTVIPRVYTFYISTALFAIFGIRMLREGYYMSKDEGHEEMEEVQADLKRRDEELERKIAVGAVNDLEAGNRVITGKKVQLVRESHIFLQALTLTFLAEWGDRSQLATIILGAREDVTGVTIGGILGHCVCTAAAVIGGRVIASRISPRTVTLVGGFVFLAFAVSALIMGPGTETI